MDRRLWVQEEDEAIIKLVEEYGNKKWTVIAQKLPQYASGLYRSGKQCRERWHNHLDPLVNKKHWTQEEERTIFKAHREHGNKWKQISKQLVGRTDNAIKNHFYSTLRRSLRRLNKYLGSKNSTTLMRDIKPCVLSKILDQSLISNLDQNHMNPDFEDLPVLLFEFSTFKPVKQKKQSKGFLFSEAERQKMEVLIQKIMSFNQNYQNEKKNKSSKRKNYNRHHKKTYKIFSPQSLQMENSQLDNDHKQIISSCNLKGTEPDKDDEHENQQIEIKIEESKYWQNEQMNQFVYEIDPPSAYSFIKEEERPDLVVIGTPWKGVKAEEGNEQQYLEQILEMHYSS